MPTPAASSSAAPLAPVASATARAAGTTEEDGCRTDGRCVSSKSRECARVPLTSAAAARAPGGRWRSRSRRAGRPSPARPRSPRTADTSPVAARLFPSRSRTRRATSSRRPRAARRPGVGGELGQPLDDGGGRSRRHRRERADRRPGPADDAQRRHDEGELGEPGLRGVLEARCSMMWIPSRPTRPGAPAARCAPAPAEGSARTRWCRARRTTPAAASHAPASVVTPGTPSAWLR